VKDLAAVNELGARLAASGVKRLTAAELTIRDRRARTAEGTASFNGAGLILCNAPWRFANTLETLLGGLAPLLAQGPGAGHLVDTISGE
jgi:23S rRNA A2030 N6-methylase RlmJ